MRILMLSDVERRGGAGRAADRLARGFQTAGHEVFRAVRFTDYADPPWPRLVLAGGEDVGWDAVPAPVLEAEAVRRLDAWCAEVRPDVVNVHNIHGAIPSGWSVDLIRACLEHAPVAWTLHDMWSFTGRCAYAMDCRAHLSDSGCDADCPTAGEYPFLPPGAIAMDFQRKRDLLAHGPQGLCAVTPSTWLRDEALASGWRGRRVEAIANGLDLEAFAPGDRLAARRALDLPEDASVLLLACADFRDPRKGAAVFLEALRLADVGRMGRPLTVLTMGREADWPPQWSTVANVRHVPLGFVAAREDQVRIYNAADLTVLPSLADNLPNTLLESLACGTPVCALALGGMADIVTPDVGSLAPEPTPEALARELEKLLENPPDRAVCRARAEERWDIVRQVQRYGQLLRELMERPGEEGA